MAVHLGNNKSYDRMQYVIPANSVYTVDFNGTTRNFFRLNNLSDIVLYCGTHSIPNAKLYDFKAPGKGVANFCEPVERERLYIYNESKSDVSIILQSWADDFNPAYMAVSEITLNNDSPVVTDGMIRGFTAELPEGSNKIGKVDVDNLSTQTDKIVKAIKDNGSSVNTSIIENKLGEISGYNLTTDNNIATMVTTLQTIADNTAGGSGGSSGNSFPEVVELRIFVPSADTLELLNNDGGITPENLTYYGFNNLDVNAYTNNDWITFFDNTDITQFELIENYNFGAITVLNGNIIDKNNAIISFTNNDGTQKLSVKVWNTVYNTFPKAWIGLGYYDDTGHWKSDFDDCVVCIKCYRKDIVMPTPVVIPTIKTDVKYIPVTLGKLFDKTIKLSDYGLTGYRVGKIIGVNDKNVNDDVFVTIKTWDILNGTPSVTDEFVHWYDFNNVDDSQKYTDKLHIQCDADTSGAIIFEVFK